MSTPTDATNYPPTDPGMLSALRGGDEAAWRDFVDYHRELIRMWARKAGCPEQALDDVAQDALVALLNALPGFRHTGRRGSFHAFVRTLVRRRVYDRLRRDLGKDGERVPVDLSEEAWRRVAAPSDGPVADLPWVSTLLHQAVRNAHARTSPATWRAFRLYCVDGQSVEAVQEALGIERPGAVYQQKSRVLTMIREELQRLLEHLDDPELAVSARRLSQKEVLQVIGDVLNEGEIQEQKANCQYASS